MEALGILRRAVPGAAGRASAALFRRISGKCVWDRLTLALLALAVLLVILTYRAYGVTWDEDCQNWYGNLVLAYYLWLFGAGPPPHWELLFQYADMYNYGALFDLIAAIVNKFSPLGMFETRHLLNGLVGVIGLVGSWKLGRCLGGPRAGFLAALLLLLIPNYYGLMFNDPKDVPFAVGCIWATYYLVRVIPFLPHPPRRLVIKLGFAIGAAMAVRVGGLLLLCYLGLLISLFAFWQAIPARQFSTLIRVGLTSLWRVFLPVALIAYALMLVFWPWAQSDPIHHPLQALAVFSKEIFWAKVLFNGHLVAANNLPWEYLPVFIGLGLPELTLALLLAAPLVGAAGLIRPSNWQCERVLPLFILGFTIVFPVVYAITVKAVLFNGMRHFIFVLPPIAVTAALTGDRALARLETFEFRAPVYAALGLYGLAHASIMALLHPDQYVYFNAFVGGVPGAENRFKLDYWGNSFAEAVRGLESDLRRQYGASFAKHQFTIAVQGPIVSARYYFPSNFRSVIYPKNADFVIGFSLQDADRALTDRPIFKVARMGALLSVVVDHREALADERRSARTPIAGASLRTSTPAPY
ncbi:MAG TPA: glycosyltransferase family 39 protein [Stellaceae bacterium]|nr:glycosyltransferase family 39 protein [Stellaceae bacterium]